MDELIKSLCAYSLSFGPSHCWHRGGRGSVLCLAMNKDVLSSKRTQSKAHNTGMLAGCRTQVATSMAKAITDRNYI